MTNFPNSVYSPRLKENRPGVVYDSAKKTVTFVEDITKLEDEVIAIEENLSDKINRISHIFVYPKGTASPLLTEDIFRFIVPQDLNGYKIVSAHAAGTSAAFGDFFLLNIRNSRLSHSIFIDYVAIDEGQKTSYTAADQPVINPSYDDLQTGDELIFDCDSEYGSIEGLQVFLTFQKVII
ncbi:MAG: hypothetical protein WC310_05450 [Patescibacteria group bacterium]|jgi:hypothetical protein